MLMMLLMMMMGNVDEEASSKHVLIPGIRPLISVPAFPFQYHNMRNGPETRCSMLLLHAAPAPAALHCRHLSSTHSPVSSDATEPSTGAPGPAPRTWLHQHCTSICRGVTHPSYAITKIPGGRPALNPRAQTLSSCTLITLRAAADLSQTCLSPTVTMIHFAYG